MILSNYADYAIILMWINCVTRWKTSLILHKMGGGADENVYISGFNSVCNFFNHTACLLRQ